MAYNKIDFINDLLSSKKIHLEEKTKIFNLTKSELKNIEIGNEDIMNRIEKIEESLKNVDKIEPERKSLTKQHNPKEILSFLKNFNQNTALKWSSHIWDTTSKYETIQVFINEIEQNRKDYKFNKLYDYNIDLYNLLKKFLFNDNKIEFEDGIPKFGWPNLNEIKFGWQYPDNSLIEWCKQNPSKFPMQYELPEKLKYYKKINGKRISTFEDVLTVFKTEIEFRENYLYNQLQIKLAFINDFNVNEISHLKGIQFYTYTRGIMNGIGKIFTFFKGNEMFKNIQIQSETIGNIFVLRITQLDSFPLKRINPDEPLNFIGGHLNPIINDFFSLCDYSIITKFKTINEDVFYGELKILHDNSEGIIEKNDIKHLETNPLLLKIDENQVKGFTHQLTFYTA
jgi:hypothetical protein